MKLYPSLKDFKNSVTEVIDFITRERVNDKRDWENLPSRFLLARKVSRIPSSSADVITGDRPDDMNWDTSYLYILIDNAGTATWRRVALGSF